MVSYKDFVDMDLNDVMRMNASELRSALQVMNKRANARLTALEGTPRGTESPVYEARDGRRFTSAGKNLNQMRESFREVKQFLSRPSSTVGGFHKLEIRTAERIGITKDRYLDDDDLRKEFWKKYREYMEDKVNGGAALNKGSDVIQSAMGQFVMRDEMAIVDLIQMNHKDLSKYIRAWDEERRPKYLGDDLDEFYRV